MSELEVAVERAVDRLVSGVERVFEVSGRLTILERDSAAHDDSIKYLRTQLHEVRSGSGTAPGLNQLNLTNRELTMEIGRLKENDEKITKTLDGLVIAVGDLKTDGKLLAWKIGAIIGVLVFVATWIADKIKF